MRRFTITLAAVALVAVAAAGAYAISLSMTESSRADDCKAADVLSSGVCESLHDDASATLFNMGVGAVVLSVLLGVGLFLLRGRLGSAVPDTGEADAVEDPDGEAPTRVCPVCSAQSRTHAETCPHCGSSFIRSKRVRASRAAASSTPFAKAVVVLSVVLIGLAAVGALKADSYAAEQKDEEQELTAAKIEAEEEAEAEREERLERQEERLERELRSTLVDDLEKSITKDAQKESEREFALIDGPILDTQCDPRGGRIDTQSRTQSFSCLAITKYTGGGGARGYRYSAEVNYDKFSYRWRLGGGGV